jgi:hypothetical protein
MTPIPVTEAFAPGLRAALLTELGDAAGAVHDLAVLRDGEPYRDRLDEALRRFDSYKVAFLALGWGDRPAALDERHAWALRTALKGWLSQAVYTLDTDAPQRGAAEQTARAQSDIAAIHAFAANAGLELS